MPFRFRLQSVLDHRAYLEEVALGEFARKLGSEQECLRQIEWLGREQRRSRGELAAREKKGVKPPEYILANEYLTILRLQALREKARLPMLEAETEVARNKVVEATRDRKALEVLKDRYLKEHEAALRKAEQAQIDEAAVNAYVRRRR